MYLRVFGVLLLCLVRIDDVLGGVEEVCELHEGGEWEERPESFVYANVLWKVIDTVLWPVNDVRFTIALGVLFSVGAFFGNLIVQSDVEDEEEEKRREEANNHHMYSFATLHLLRDNAPKWLRMEICDRVEDLLRRDLFDFNEGYAASGSFVVDFALIFQHLQQLSKGEYGDSALLAKPDEVDRVVRSKAVQVLKIIKNGPDSPDQVLLDRKGYKVVVDYLTETFIIQCKFAGKVNHNHDLAALIARFLDKPGETMVELGLEEDEESFGVKVLDVIQEEINIITKPLLEGEIFEILQAQKSFKVIICGFGLGGSVATSLGVALSQKEGKGIVPEVFAFGPAPCISFAGEFPSTAINIHTFLSGSDFYPRLTAENLQVACDYLNGLEELIEPRERIIRILQDEPSKDWHQLLKELTSTKYAGLIQSRSEQQLEKNASTRLPMLKIPGGITLVQNVQGSNMTRWYKLTSDEHRRLCLISSTRVLSDHSLRKYEEKIRLAS